MEDALRPMVVSGGGDAAHTVQLGLMEAGGEALAGRAVSKIGGAELVAAQQEMAGSRRARRCCSCIHHVSLAILVIGVVATIVFVALGAAGALGWGASGTLGTVSLLSAGGIGVCYNRKYLTLGTLTALVDELDVEIGRLGGVVTSLEATARSLGVENGRYVDANTDHERIVGDLRVQVQNQQAANGQLTEALAGYQAGIRKFDELVGAYEKKIDSSEAELAEQTARIEAAGDELEAFEARIDGVLGIMTTNVERNKGIANRAMIALTQMGRNLDLDADNLKQAEANKKIASDNLVKERELNDKQAQMFEEQAEILKDLRVTSDKLEENVEEYERLNDEFEANKKELRGYREQISRLSTRVSRQEESMKSAVRRIQVEVQKSIASVDGVSMQRGGRGVYKQGLSDLGTACIRAVEEEF